MKSIVSINKLVHKLHLNKMGSSFREFRRDSSGGFLIPTSSKVTDSDYAKYRHLPVDWSILPITNDIFA